MKTENNNPPGLFPGLHSWYSFQPVFRNIGRCIVAKCGHFQDRKVHQIANRCLERFLKLGVPLFTEMLPNGPEKQGIEGDFSIC
ncbi:MAG: hypothetical protein WC379_10280 [Methanoregula sp.]